MSLILYLQLLDQPQILLIHVQHPLALLRLTQHCQLQPPHLLIALLLQLPQLYEHLLIAHGLVPVVLFQLHAPPLIIADLLIQMINPPLVYVDEMLLRVFELSRVTIFQVVQLLRVVFLELPTNIVCRLQDTLHVEMRDLFAFEEFLICTIHLVLHTLETLL